METRDIRAHPRRIVLTQDLLTHSISAFSLSPSSMMSRMGIAAAPARDCLRPNIFPTFSSPSSLLLLF